KQYLNLVRVKVDGAAVIAEVEQALRSLLRVRHGSEDFQIRNTASLLETAAETQNTLTLLLGSVAAISLLVGGIGVMNIMLVSVTERTREIGVRMATGARRSNILLQFNTEALVVCGIGGVAGVLTGIGGGLLAQALGMRVAFTAGPALLAFGSAVATRLLFGYLPARNAAHLDPVVALTPAEAARPTSIKLLLVPLPLLRAGCALTPEYQRPTMMIPSDWDNAVPGHAAAVDETWWQRFGSAELAELMAEAMVANQDLAVALARIEQARATARGASAGRLPDVSAGLSAGRSRSDGRTRESGQAELSIAYELDLWRANAAAAQAAQARLLASAYDLEAAQLVLQAELATTYFRALALKSRLAIARDNLAIARQLL